MRCGVGFFGLLCGVVVVGLVGRYGYRSTDFEADAWITAFLFSAIAAGGLFGHAVAVRLWRYSKAASIATGLISAVALLLNLSNSLGALAGRADRTTMERVNKNREIRAAEAELKRLIDRRTAMAPFTPTDASVIDAARRAADRAEESRKAECGDGDPKQRGRNCHDRESDERIAAEALAKAMSEKTGTDQAAQLDAAAEVERKKLSELGEAVTVNVQGSALARLFRLPEAEADFAATAQQFEIAAIVELIIVMCMVAWEVLSPKFREPKALSGETAESRAAERPVATAEPVTSNLIEAEPSSVAGRRGLPETAVLATALLPVVTEPASAMPPAGSLRPKTAIPRSRPRLTHNGARVAQVMADALTPAKGRRVQLGLGYLRYAAALKEDGEQPLAPEAFMDAMAAFCRGTGIRTRIDGDKLYLLDVELSRMPAEQ